MRLFAIIIVGVAASGVPASDRPNIVFFLVDDMGWQDTSQPFHTEMTVLNKRYRTPNVERLAGSGVRFTQAYACSMCSPSRVSLMTGVNAARHRVTNWTLRKDKSPDSPNRHVVPPAWNVNGLSAEAGTSGTYQAITLPSLLRGAGYRTIHVGKAHFGASDTPGADPRNVGFDVNIAGHAAGGPGSYLAKHNYSSLWRNTEKITDVPGLDKYHGTETYLTEALTIEANKAMDAAVAEGKPFYLYMAHYAVHSPFEADPRFVGRYRDAGLKGLPATFASMIEGMDKSLGDIVANIRRLGVAENTIIVFMSDNGSPPQTPRNRPLRGHKITPYEGGIRVPLIVHWPGVTEKGATCEQYVIIEDVFPTILQMAGVEFGEQPDGPIDGVSFAPQLKNTTDTHSDRPLYWHYPNTYGQLPFSIIRKGDWKLIYHHIGRRYELFNLADDLGETNNMAEQRPEIRKRLAKALGIYLAKVEAQMPVDKSTGAPIPYPR